MKIQNTKMYVGILAMMIAGQSYAAGVEAVDTKFSLENVLEPCGSILGGFLQPGDLVRLATTGSELHAIMKELPVYRLDRAIGQTDLSATYIDLSNIRDALKSGDKLYLDAMALPQTPANAPRIRELLENATTSRGGSNLARKSLNREASCEGLGFTVETGRLYLIAQAESGDMDAQTILNTAAFRGDLGFDGAKGRAYLEKRSMVKDEDAQRLLNQAAGTRCLGFEDASGLAYLETRIALGDRHAQMMLNCAARFGNLGFNPETGRNHLDGRIALGDTHAQRLLNDGAKLGRLGFNQESGLAYLKDRVHRFQDKDAQSSLASAAEDDIFGLGYYYLKRSSAAGDIYAQKALNRIAANQSFYLFDDRTAKAYLEDRVRRFQDEDALKDLVYAAFKEKLGFRHNAGSMDYVWKHVKLGHTVYFDSPLLRGILDLRKDYRSRI